MPGYLLHLAACQTATLKNRSFTLGVEAPDLLKKYLKMYKDIDQVEKKYETLRTPDMPEFKYLKERIQQKESAHSDEGLHYGLSSSPNIEACLENLTEEQKNEPFWRGYVWHLVTDALMYNILDIESKFEKTLEKHKGSPNIEELQKNEVKKLHDDWDKTNLRVHNDYPEISLPDEIKELGVVQFKQGNLEYVIYEELKDVIEYLRKFDPLKEGNFDEFIGIVMSIIGE